MDFTGERYVPSLEGQIKYEHLHRYALALELVAGKSVMDIASGEGYGAALLASTANSVTGVDIDLETVEHARKSYYDSNLTFIVGSCESIPLPDASFDVITSFETIEHHDKHEEMLGEIKRLLKPEGVLIISSPNRLTYSDEPGYCNPFHVKELYYHEFHELLQQRFKHVRIYGQRLATGSFLFPLKDSNVSGLKAFSGSLGHVSHQVRAFPSPIYFVAVCSDSRAIEEWEMSSVYLDPADDLFKLLDRERTDQIRRMQDEVVLQETNSKEQMARVRSEYEARINLQSHELMETRVNDMARIRHLEEDLAQAGAQLEDARAQRDNAVMQIQNDLARLSDAQLQLSRHAELLDTQYTSSLERISPKRSWKRFENRIRRLPPQEIFHGVLDFPRSDQTYSNCFEIYGWVYSIMAPVRMVQAFLNDVYVGVVQYGTARPDVMAAFPAQAPLGCGYKERIWLISPKVKEHRILRLRVCDEKGNQQVYTRTITMEPLPSLSPAPSVEPGATAATQEVANSKANSKAEPNPAESLMAKLSIGMEDTIAEFQSRMQRDPFILDWNSGLKLASLFPRLAVFSPPPVAGSQTTLPYLDHSVDMVVTACLEEESLSEARRVASTAVIRSPILDGERLQHLTADESPVALDVEWRNAQISEPSQLPTASIIIPVYNKVAYTEKCLDRLSQTLPRHFKGEIIVVDDASSDETPAVLQNWAEIDKRIKVLRNPENAGFVRSCNRGAEASCSEILVFLNNDTLPLPGWLPPLLKILRDRPGAGAVGGKLIYPDGKLQEAGGVIFSNGSACNFGKYDEKADAPLYSFVREVDYCSGALLATPRALFMEIGKFDTRFEPAYYEDTDYCLSLRERGYSIFYQPESVIVHFEGASSGTDTNAGVKSYQTINRAKFVEKWGKVLQRQPVAPDRYDLATLHRLSLHSTVQIRHENP